MERIIFVLSYEKRWECWMIFANRATDAGDFFLSTGRYFGTEEIEVLPVIKQITEITQKYDIPALFRQFGRKTYKDERIFLQKVEESYIREHIRPYIEKLVARVIDELGEAGFPVFLKGSRLDNFYKNQRLFLQSAPLRSLLRFERTGEFTRYILRLTDGKKVFAPADYDIKILTRQPCRIMMGRQLFGFPEDFDGQRLLPFLQKQEVMIPKANEQLYFRKFILKNIRHEEIEVQGFEVIVREVEKKAVLSLEHEIFALPVFALEFWYGNQCIPAWSERKALVELRTEGDSYAFYKVNRDLIWEEQQEEKLQALGLIRYASGCFKIEGLTFPAGKEEERTEKISEDEVAVAWQKMVGWVREHRFKLEELGIGFTQKALRKPYYLGNWQMDFSIRDMMDWFEIKAEVVLADGRRIPLLRFRDHILSGRQEYLLEDGSVFFIPEEWFATYADILLFASGKGGSLFLCKSQYSLLEKSEIKDTKLFLQQPVESVALPDGLKAVLRPYQQSGYEWMYRLFHSRLGGCLADDMGLGKTLQTIALLLRYRQEAVKPRIKKRPETGMQMSLFEDLAPAVSLADGDKPEFHTCLIVVPASLIHNWRNELRKFAPQLTVTTYAGYNRSELRPYLQRSDVAIVTYHTLRNDIDELAKLKFGIVVADEAQTLKNPSSQLHQAMMRIQGECFFALSGTPIENSLTDLWAIINFVNRDMLGSHHFFRNHFIKPILVDMEGRMSAILRKLIKPYVLRRTKEEVLADLPDLTTGIVLCEPEEEQRKAYEEEQSKVRNYILGKRGNQEGLRNDFMVLKALIRLRQIANHPRLIDPDYGYGSGKFREVFRMLDEVIGNGHKVLVFSSFVKYLKMVADEATALDWKYAVLTGSTVDREKEISRFSTDPECPLFLVSLKAGGVGLNLTEADYVFILDPWWNLAAENQAIGRAHRIGQKQAVFVYRFITADTLEQKILAIQQRKQRLADSVITTTAPIPLSDEELLEALE